MFRRSRVTKGVRNYHFYCDARRRKLDGECKQTYIKEAPLVEAVKEAAGKQMQLLGSLRKQWEGHAGAQDKGEKRHEEILKKEIEQEILLIKKQKRELYGDLKEGMLEQEDFAGEWERLSKRQIFCEKSIKEMGYLDPAEKEAMKAMQEFPKRFFEPENEVYRWNWLPP